MSNCIIRRIIQLKYAIIFQKLTVKNSANIDITNQCKYSWSVDNVCWTTWADYKDYVKITPNLDSDFFLRILIQDSLLSVALNDCITTDYNICIDSTIPFLKDFCSEPNLFQPYNNLDCALLLQQQLADSVICMFGIPIYYFKTSPVQESADYTFKEYVLHNVTDVKQLKLMIPDGQMPSSNYKLSEWDFEWETDWETEISKSQFAAAFGDNEFPNSNDFIYIPMMKRMWDVNSAYDEKNEGLLWRPTTWKLALTKFNDAENISPGDFEQTINQWTANRYEDIFGKLEDNEQERLTGSQQLEMPAYAASNLYDIFMEDSIRAQFTKDDIEIIDKMYCHRNNIVSRNIYKFNDKGLITYQKGFCGEEGTIILLIQPNQIQSLNEKKFLEFGPLCMSVEVVNNIYNINVDGIKFDLDEICAYMVIYGWNRSTFNRSVSVYKQAYNKNMPAYLIRPESYWFDFENPYYTETTSYNNDYIQNKPQKCSLMGYPLDITNIKYYDRYLDPIDAIKESVKYTTVNSHCIINDLARPLNSGLGYAVK